MLLGAAVGGVAGVARAAGAGGGGGGGPLCQTYPVTSPGFV